MEENLLADKYARALVLCAQKAGVIERVEKELVSLEKILQKQPQLQQIFTSPIIALKEKENLLKTIVEKGKFLPLMVSFLFLLLQMRRFHLFSQVGQIYRESIYSLRQRMKVFVESALSLKAEEKEALLKKLAQIYQRNIDLFVRINPELIGGARIYVGHTLFDATIKAYLAQLRNLLH